MKARVICMMMIVVVAVALAFGNPYSMSWPLKCPLYWMTGLQCPLCGMQRATHELAHLNFLAAWHLNAGFILCSPYLALLVLGQLYPPSMEWKIMKWGYQDKVIFSAIGLMMVWGVIRNI